MTTVSLYQYYLKYPIICTDTRKITKGCLFFALKGDNFDANTFAKQALDEGAAYVIVDNPDYAKGEQYLLVENVLSTLQELAKYHRKQLNIPVIGLTGSNGKTTTKELIRAVLQEKYKVFATEGNLNNHIGVPLSILSITSAIEIAVIEMGANHQKEIEFLCEIAQPTHGLISNVGKAHLEGFGGFEGVKKGKGELYQYLSKNKGRIFINAANSDLMKMLNCSNAKNITPYLIQHRNIVDGKLLSSDPYLRLEWSYLGKLHEVETQLTGSYNFENILAAICIGVFFKLSPEEINKGLKTYQPQNNRSQVQKTANNTLICDFYNANPSSMEVAIKNLATLHAEHKIAILGDMFELGETSNELHHSIVQQAIDSNLNQCIFIGKSFYAWKNNYNALFFETREQAFQYLTTHTISNALVLIKGSRGMALEKLLPLL